ncbi:1-phosphatidylinositol 3-phosphate 5-kinase isoform X2 [Orussus abietinus]|uniref:1-phosphatidylinositol 3-phosphate 5-kinase isoform X2 n=1 Tax=Orussus abietinus TaxID=222816 RepID=UPI0006260293|nr:1-phosphatidylinositol 3-phosphate 5-kinase isoform X2 [Orussus abietinus]
MNKNMNSPSKLTEFAPLSPEGSQPVVASLFSKFFGFAKNAPASHDETMISPDNDDRSSSGESESWKRSESVDKTPDDDSSSVVNFPLDTSEGRSLPNVLKRISKIVALRSNNLRSYKDTQLRSYWMPDSVSKQCYECGERFTTFRRRHHCRVCGQIFCSKCCRDEIPGKIMGCTGYLRVCTYCCKVVLSYLQSSDMRSDLTADLKALQEDLRVKYGNESPPLARKDATEIIDDEVEVRRKPSVGYMEEKYALGRSSSGYLTSQERSLALQNSASLKMIYEELFHSSKAILLQTHRIRLKSYHDCFLGSELVNWMIAQNKAATRVQATAIGRALLEAGFIEPKLVEDDFTDSTAIFKPVKLPSVQRERFLAEAQASCDAQEPAWVKTIPQHDSTTDSESETKHPPASSQMGRLPSSSSSFYLDLDLEASTVTLKRPTSEDFVFVSVDGNDPSTDEKDQEGNPGFSDELFADSLQVQEYKERNGWYKVNNLRTAFEEMDAYNCLTTAYRQHEDSLVGQLLSKEGLSRSWSDAILRISHQIVDHVRPDLNHDADDMDIRQYVRIKKSPGGSRRDCEIVSGVVCSKNVAHRNMNAMIAHPKILLLRCGLMYQRVEGKLLTLEPVMMQENEYLGHTVARITALGPDVVLVHRSVSRLAQDRLRESGVTLVLNVKLSVLERVARCTGANIVSTIDAHLTARYRLGACKKFYLRNFPNGRNGTKTLMYFEGCANPHLGSTILLRGGALSELKRVKKVTAMMIFAAYSWRLEKSFLMDEFAKPPSPKDNNFLEETAKKDFSDGDAIDDAEERDSGEDLETVEVHPEVSEPTKISPFSTAHDAKKLQPKTGRSEDTFPDDESGTGSDVFRQVSSILSDNSDPYDTLKLFKPKSRAAVEEEKRRNVSERSSEKPEGGQCDEDRGGGDFKVASDRANDATVPSQTVESAEEKVKPRDEATTEEKRTYGRSVSDRSDPLHQYLNEEDIFEDENGPSGQRLSVADLPLLNKFKKALEDTILSVSPYMKFSIPYLETEPGRNCILRCFFPKDVFYSMYFTDKIEGARTSGGASSGPVYPADPMANLKLKREHPFVQAKLTSGVECREVQTLLADFRARGSRLRRSAGKSPQVEQAEDKRQQGDPTWPDCLDPESHQRLSVLFCSFSQGGDNTPAFCVNPWIVNMDLYGRNDIALGRFLERYCLTSDYKCPAQACRARISRHARRFTHDSGCVHVTLSELATRPLGLQPRESERILLWSKCLDCQEVSPVVPMSDDAWSLSFAKYLELRFHGGVYGRRGSGGASQCLHSLHHRHTQYFAKGNMLAVFRFSRISLWEISLPPPSIRVEYDPRRLANVLEETKNVALKGDEVFSAVREKLATLPVEPDALAQARQQLAKDQQYFRNKIEEVQLKLTSPTLENRRLEGKESERQVQALVARIEDGIVILKRLIAEAVFGWNARILEAVAAARKRDDRPRRLVERAATVNTVVADGDATEDTASESQLEDCSPGSADYNAVDVVSVEPSPVARPVLAEASDGEIEEAPLVQGSPRTHHRSHSDVLPLASDDAPDRKRKKKTILSQLLPSAAAVDPIANPLPAVAHHLLPLGSVVPIAVYETEPSSIIAYALDSHDYKHALQELPRSVANSSPLYKRKFPDSGKEALSEATQPSEPKRPSVLSFLRGNGPNPGSPLDPDKSLTSSTANSGTLADSSSVSTTAGAGAGPAIPEASSNPQEAEEEKRAVKQQNYIEVQFNDATTNFFCRVYFASQFAALRESVLPCGEDGFTRSLSRSVQWAARGGKSGSAFCKTRDDRFILKEMSRLEMQIFLDFAPNYFAYMEKCQRTRQPTLLGKIVGVYRVSFKNDTTNAALRTSLLVMENLFYGRTITDKFDLKGSVRNRLVNPEDAVHEGELVLLDENLLNMSCDSPLYIRVHSKAVLNKAIEKDTKFLADNSVMDYSLLVGLEPNSDELVLGIIGPLPGTRSWRRW